MAVRSGASKSGRPRAPPDQGGGEAERRATAIRNHLLPLVKLRGQRHQYGHVGRAGRLHLTTWTTDRFRCVLRVPYGPPEAQPVLRADNPEPIPPRRCRPAPLACSLDVWLGHRMLSIAWALNGTFEVIVFRRGAWEEEALALG